MERLGPLDATFLFVEDGVSHMHIASCAVFAGPAPSYRHVVSAIERKLPLVPRYRQVVRFVPLQLGRPVWADDAHFNLEYHIRHSALPPPGGNAELRALMGRLMSQELDRRRPLWEVWMVEGLEAERWALVTKIHHCMADGVSGTDLLAVILDTEPSPPAPPAAPPWCPRPQPSPAALAAEALAQSATLPLRLLGEAAGTARSPARLARQARDVTEGLTWYARRLLLPPGPTSIAGTIGPNRRWTWASSELADLKAIRKAFGGTVNDVILAVIAGGFRQLLLSRGEPADSLALRSLVPVSVRREDEHGRYDNRVSAILADLPVAVDDPVARLEAVRCQMDALKASHQTEAGERLTALSAMAPFVGLAFGERAATGLMRHRPQQSVNTVTTNVPGPQFPLYLAGREMTDYLPFVPIAHGVRIGVAIVSYNGKVAFGITGDFDTAADIDVLAAGISDGVAELLAVTYAASAKVSSTRRRHEASSMPSSSGVLPSRTTTRSRAGHTAIV